MYLRCRWADTVPVDGLVLFVREGTSDTAGCVRTVFKRMGCNRMRGEGAVPTSAFLNTGLPNSPPTLDTDREISEAAAARKADGASYRVRHTLGSTYSRSFGRSIHVHVNMTCTCTRACTCGSSAYARRYHAPLTPAIACCIVLSFTAAATAAAYDTLAATLATLTGRPRLEVLNELYRCKSMARLFCIRLLRAEVHTPTVLPIDEGITAGLV